MLNRRRFLQASAALSSCLVNPYVFTARAEEAASMRAPSSDGLSAFMDFLDSR